MPQSIDTTQHQPVVHNRIDFARQSRPLDRDESQFVVDRHTKGPLKPAEQISTHNAARARRRRHRQGE
jgi:hypothetical protein